MTPDPGILTLVLVTTIVIYLITMKFLTSANQKILYTLFVLCFFLYNGYGAAYPGGVYDGYLNLYIVFLSSLSIAFVFCLAVLRKEIRFARRGSISFLTRLFEDQGIVLVTIGTYYLLLLVPLCYPEFKLPLLLSPPAPDIAQEFEMRYTAPPGTVIKLVQALSYLVFPFYLISATYFRKNLLTFTLLIAFPYYIQYCDQSYISRGEVLAMLFIIGAVQWYFRPGLRKYILIGALLLLPLLPISLLWYGEARSRDGDTDIGLTTSEAFQVVWYTETSFPVFSEKIIKSGKHIDLSRYALWIITLPVPKGIIGSINAPSAGMEMSEILLGTKFGRQGFYALLAGLLTESVYIYGLRLYFIHAIMIGLIMAFIARLTENEPLLFVIFMILVIDLTYRLNRAGVGATLPSVVNQHFALYLIFLLGYMKARFGMFRSRPVIESAL